MKWFLDVITKTLIDEKYSRYLIKIWVGVIVITTIYNSYLLGWTRKFVPSEINPWLSWSTGRAVYANKGLNSVIHMNFVSISLATGVILLGVVLTVLILKTDIIFKDTKLIYTTYALLILLSIYTFFTIDTPTNYYNSRYFLPVVIPTTILLFIMVSNMMKLKYVFVIIFIVSLLFNIRYDYYLFKDKVFQERFTTIEQLQSIIPENEYVFVNDDLFLRRLITEPLSKKGNRKVIFIENKENQSDIKEVTKKINQYVDHLKIKNYFIISPARLSTETKEYIIEFNDDRQPWQIMYPTTLVERRFKYFIYRISGTMNKLEYDIGLNDDEYIRNMHKQEGKDLKFRWTKHSSIVNLYLDKAKSDYKIYINILGYRPKEEKTDVKIYINDNEIGTLVTDGKATEEILYIENVYLNDDIIQELRIDCETWIPSKYGWNDDRELGIAIDYIKIKRINK